MTRRQVAFALVAMTLLLTAACSDDAEPAAVSGARPVTVAESERLASVRFRNFDAGSRKVTATYTDQGHDVALEGWYDYTTHTGYGLVSADGVPSDRIVWDGRILATTAGDHLGEPVTSLEGWQAGKLDAGSSPLAVVLTVLAGLGADRPENPLLIRQGGALWLREDTAGRQAVTVFAGPTDGRMDEADPDAAGIHYWVDRTGLAHRVDVRLGKQWAVVTLEDATVTVPAVLEDVDPRAIPDTRRSAG
ncbi:hypothetical protein [Promicromonospora sp. NPDC060271]|uniref:hypothetical protein n=1 Tax=Promicromonospora sp. NPDC060271 TaxID=3347089 RepID=UPI003651AAC6